MSFRYSVNIIFILVKNFLVSVRYHFDLEILIWILVNRSQKNARGQREK